MAEERRDNRQFQQDQRFDWLFLRNKTERVSTVLWDTQAATAANYGVFWIAPSAGFVVAVSETHKVAGTAGGTVSLDIEKLTSGQALDGGTTVLSAALSLKTTADTPQSGTLNADVTRTRFSATDRLALKDAGTLTNVSGVCVTVTIRYQG